MRIGVLRRAVPVLVLVLLSVVEGRAQLRNWQAYPALREVLAVDASETARWAATRGGVFSYAPVTGEIGRYTTVQGLHRNEAATLHYDPARDAVWIGYEDGVFDRLDVASGAVTSFFDIARADQYNDRAVRRFRLEGDTLFIATAFGVVAFDVARGEVRSTYARLGPLEAATPVHDVLVAPLPDGAGEGLWVATEAGVVRAPLASPNLQQPSAWTFEEDAPRPATCLAFHEGSVHACGGIGVEKREDDGQWVEMLFAGSPALDLVVEGDVLYVLTQFSLVRFAPDTGNSSYTFPSYDAFTSMVVGPEGAVWVGDEIGGLLGLPPLPAGPQVPTEPATVVVPDGPYNNAIRDVAVGEGGVVWTAHQIVQNAIGVGVSAASRRDEAGWTWYLNTEADLPNATLLTAALGPDGAFYAASQGDGLLAIGPDGQAITYREENSTLLPITGTDLVDLGDAVPDAAGRVWVTNKASPLPLHVLSPDGTWTGLPRPPGLPSSVNLERMVIDPFGQMWFTARQTTGAGGAGVAAVSTGADPLDPSDDRALHINQVGTNGTGLPSEDVTALAFDGQDRLWIGTRRGLAIVFTPGAAFGGDPALATPQWARTADGTSYLLRDLSVNALAVDPAGQIWIGSTTGAWLLNANGDEVLLNLTTRNSPLFSDNVLAVDVDEATGRVYFATDRGLLSAAGEATAPAPVVQALTVAPSPYRPAEHGRGVLISGLVAETTVYVLTPDGRRIAALEARGGSARWDGRDERTGEPVASGIYLVAAVAEGGQATAYGKVAVIR